MKLAYAIAHSSNTKGYMGAVLITDDKGFPLEFKYSDPIVPTKIQQVLYGQGLEKYIKLEVITNSLMKSISNHIDYLLVEDKDLLDYKSDSPLIVRISSTSSEALENEGEVEKIKKNEFLLQTSKSSSPVRLQFNDEFNQEESRFDELIDILTEAGKFIDITEPIDRVSKTIELICNQEV